MGVQRASTLPVRILGTSLAIKTNHPWISFAADKFKSGLQNAHNRFKERSRIRNLRRNRESPARRQFAITRRIGYWGIFILMSGNLAISGIFGWILFLWGNSSRSTNDTWRWIILNDKINIAVTIPSTILRIFVTAQAAVCTTMLAAIAIENYGTRFHRSARLSMMRAWGTNPYDLFWNWIFSPNAWPLLLLTLVLTATTLEAQFTATLLISDLGSQFVGGYNRTETAYYASTELQQSMDPREDWSSVAPSIFPSFAEWVNTSTVESNDGVDDTGMILRALFPISSVTTRQTIQSYSGPATVLDVRVICVQPIIYNLTYDKTPDNSIYSGAVSGGIQVNTSSSIPPGSFNCSQAIPPIPGEWATSLCSGSGAYDPDTTFPASYPGFEDQPLPYLVLNFTSPEIVQDQALQISNWTNSASHITAPWVRFESPDYPGLAVSLSFCMMTFQYEDTNITAYGNNNRTEPSLSSYQEIDFFGGGQNFTILNTTQVVRQLNSDSMDITERGIMSLEPPQPSDIPTTNNPFSGLLPSPDQTKGLCSFCCDTMDEVLAATFQFSLQATGSLAKALQSVMWLTVVNAYYNR